MKKSIAFIQLLLSYFRVSLQKGVSNQNIDAFIRLTKPSYLPSKLIRVGGNDGGYLVPEDIATYDIVISPGVGHSTDFDAFFYEKNKKVVMIDPGNYSFENENIVFYKAWLKGYESRSRHYMSLEQIISLENPELKKSVLQIDIEGGEYEVFSSISENTMKSFGVIAAEFHHLGLLTTVGGYELIAPVFNKILETHFVAHLHVNNSGRIHKYKNVEIPETLEITFLNRDTYQPDPKATFSSPHPLDKPCINFLPEKNVPKCWYQS